MVKLELLNLLGGQRPNAESHVKISREKGAHDFISVLVLLEVQKLDGGGVSPIIIMSGKDSLVGGIHHLERTRSNRLQASTSYFGFQMIPLGPEVPRVARVVQIRMRVKTPLEGRCSSKSERADVGQLLQQGIKFLLGLDAPRLE